MFLEHVSDAADPRLDDFRHLTDSALRRREEAAGGLYIAESEIVIARACAAGHRPRAVLTQQRWLPRISEAISDADVPVYVVPDAVAETVTGFAVHRGALASMYRPAVPDAADLLADASLVLVLEDIADPTNIGAAFRAAAGLGADAVLVSPRCGDPLYRRSVRVSMGTVFQVPWTRLPTWPDAAGILHAAGFEIAALALSDDAVPLGDYASRRGARVALVLGTEGAGLSADALAASDHIVTIPMRAGVDSLNVASAAAVALWALGYPPVQ